MADNKPSGLKQPAKRPTGLVKPSSVSKPPVPVSSSVPAASKSDLIVGDRVLVSGTKPGHIQYLGETQFAAGQWAGVVLDQPVGKNDGSVAGVRYFQMIIILSALIGLTVCLYLVYYKYIGRSKLKMPGYNGLPLIGIIPFLKRDFPVQLTEWGRKLGPIFSIKMVGMKWVILSNYQSIKEVLVKHGKVSSSRPIFQSMTQNGDTFLVCQDVKDRKSYLSNLMRKQLGDGNKTAEIIIAEEIEHLNEALHSQVGQPFDIMPLLPKASGNIVSHFFMGKRKMYDDPWIQRYNAVMDNTVKHPTNAPFQVLLGSFTFLRSLPIFKSISDELKKWNEKRLQIFQELVDECREALPKYSGTTKPVFVQVIHDNQMGNDLFTEDQLKHLLYDLTFAGTDTASTTILWCILYLMINTKVQDEVWNEIKTCFGNNPPEMAGKSHMPLTSSFIDEIMRVKTVTPIAIFHKTTEDIALDDCYITKGSTVIPLLYAAHRDPKYFTDPNTVIPDRFINKETGLYEKSKYVMPFGVGPRTCFGYKLAEMEIFMFLCGILQKFSLHCEDDENPPNFEDGSFGFLYFPKPFKIVLKPRK